MSPLFLIALHSGASSSGFAGLISGGANTLWLPLVGALCYMLKALADACRAANKSPCTRQACRKEQIKHGLSKIALLAVIIVVIILAIMWCSSLAMETEERNAIEEELRKEDKAELTHEIRRELSLKTLITIIDNVEADLMEQNRILKDQTAKRHSSHENRYQLQAAVSSLISILRSKQEICRMSEELIGRVEAENVAGALFSMQKALIKSLYPEFYQEEADRMALLPGMTLPERPLLLEEEIYERRRATVAEFEKDHFPALKRLRKAFEDRNANLKQKYVE